MFLKFGKGIKNLGIVLFVEFTKVWIDMAAQAASFDYLNVWQPFVSCRHTTLKEGYLEWKFRLGLGNETSGVDYH